MSRLVHPIRVVRLTACLIGAALLCGAPTDAVATTIVGGNIINQTWTSAGSPYVVQGDITVPSGAFLTIQAGTVVQFASSDGQVAGIDTGRIELTVHGVLNVNGTAVSPVTFQAQSGTAANTWYGIVAAVDAVSVFITGATIQHAYAGITNNSGGFALSVSNVTISATTYGALVSFGTPRFSGVTITGSSYGLYVNGSGAPTVTNSLLYGNASYGVYASASSGAPTTTISGCTLHANGGYGVYAASAGGTPAVVVKNSNVTGHSSYGLYRATGTINVSWSNVWGNGTNSSGASVGAGVLSCNPLYVNPSSNLRLTSNSPSRAAGDTGGDLGPLPFVADATPGFYGTLWTDTTVPTGVTTIAGDVTVAPGITLTLSPGATLQFASSDLMACGVDTVRAELNVNGKLVANGTPAQPITLTSAGASANTWYGLTLGGAVASSLTYANISNAYYGLTIQSGAAHVIAHDDISSTSYGVSITAGSPAMDALTVRGSVYGFIVSGAGGLVLTNSVIRSNQSYGIYVSPSGGTPVVSVRNCTLNANGPYGIFATSAGASPIVDVVNSIVTGHTSYGLYRASGTFTYSYSDVWGNGTNVSGVTPSSGNISQNPMYAGAPTDLSLQAGSVCIDTGTSVGAPDHDLLGAARPTDGDGINGAQWDMGAYEFVLTDLCAGVVCTALDACHAAGTCNAATGLCSNPPSPDGTACGNYVCEGGACLTTCATGADCSPGAWCSTGTCQPKLARGDACGGAASCATGWCVDGRCCDTACTGQCESCSVPALEGTCSPVTGAPAGSRAACTTDGGVCGGACNGTSRTACTFPTGSCRTASCDAVGNAATAGAACDGQGHCPAERVVSCSPFVCGATACKGDCTQDADCVAGDFCASGTCQARLATGTSCGGATQCASGFCVDSVCCESACGGQCEACNEPGHAGSCVPATGAPGGGRPACAGIGACQGSCDGAGRAACTFPAGETTCFPADCALGKAIAASSCDGAGSCSAGTESPCGAYACDLVACKTTCSSDADCAGGHSCSGGTCTAFKPVKSSGCSSAGSAGDMAWLFAAALGMLLARRRRLAS